MWATKYHDELYNYYFLFPAFSHFKGKIAKSPLKSLPDTAIDCCYIKRGQAGKTKTAVSSEEAALAALVWLHVQPLTNGFLSLHTAAYHTLLVILVLLT